MDPQAALAVWVTGICISLTGGITWPWMWPRIRDAATAPRERAPRLPTGNASRAGTPKPPRGGGGFSPLRRHEFIIHPRTVTFTPPGEEETEPEVYGGAKWDGWKIDDASDRVLEYWSKVARGASDMGRAIVIDEELAYREDKRRPISPHLTREAYERMVKKGWEYDWRADTWTAPNPDAFAMLADVGLISERHGGWYAERYLGWPARPRVVAEGDFVRELEWRRIFDGWRYDAVLHRWYSPEDIKKGLGLDRFEQGRRRRAHRGHDIEEVVTLAEGNMVEPYCMTCGTTTLGEVKTEADEYGLA